MEWLGGLIEVIDCKTMHDWTPMLTDGNLFGLKRFTAVYNVDMPRLARVCRYVFSRAKAGSQF
jgi:hypothetical protein